MARIAGKRITKRHNLSGPQGVRGRNSDNTRLREVLRWNPPSGWSSGTGRDLWMDRSSGSFHGSCVRSGFRCGGLTRMSSNVSLGGDIRCCWDRASRVVSHPLTFFSQGIEKEYCNSGL